MSEITFADHPVLATFPNLFGNWDRVACHPFYVDGDKYYLALDYPKYSHDTDRAMAYIFDGPSRSIFYTEDFTKQYNKIKPEGVINPSESRVELIKRLQPMFTRFLNQRKVLLKEVGNRGLEEFQLKAQKEANKLGGGVPKDLQDIELTDIAVYPIIGVDAVVQVYMDHFDSVIHSDIPPMGENNGQLQPINLAKTDIFEPKHWYAFEEIDRKYRVATGRFTVGYVVSVEEKDDKTVLYFHTVETTR